MKSAIDQFFELPRAKVEKALIDCMCPSNFSLEGKATAGLCRRTCKECWTEPRSEDSSPYENIDIEWIPYPLLEQLPTLVHLYEVCSTRNQHEKAESVWTAIGKLLEPQIEGMRVTPNPSIIIDRYGYGSAIDRKEDNK